MENTQFKIANLPAFVMAVVKELLPVGTVLTRKGLNRFLLTFPRPNGVIQLQKPRTIFLEFDEDLTRKLHTAFLENQEQILTECADLIFDNVQMYLQRTGFVPTNPDGEVINLSLTEDLSRYRRA